MNGSASAISCHDSEIAGIKLSTDSVPLRDRQEWLQEIIREEYTRVAVSAPADGNLFNEMTIYEWKRLRLSSIRSHAITIERHRGEPFTVAQDNYLAVVLLSGSYLLEQNGRETFLQPGDMAIYDATRPHRIHCPGNFSKLIVTVPRSLMRERIAGVEHCTAMRIPGHDGIGAVAANFIRSAAEQVCHMDENGFSELSDHSLDLLTMALTSVRPQNFNLSRSRSISLNRVENFVEQHLSNAAMDTSMVSGGTGLSARYINDLFSDKGTSLMRYVWDRRLENCRNDMLNPAHSGHRISEIAWRWGFNDLSHFSRSFKDKFGRAPRDVRMDAANIKHTAIH